MKHNFFRANNSDRSSEHGVERERLPADVYYVYSDRDDSVLIGMDVEIIRGDNGTLVHWLDTVKERRMMAVKTKSRDNGFSFTREESEGGGIYNFTPMSIEIYNEYVKNNLRDGANFDNLDVLNAAFLSTKELGDY